MHQTSRDNQTKGDCFPRLTDHQCFTVCVYYVRKIVPPFIC